MDELLIVLFGERLRVEHAPARGDEVLLFPQAHQIAHQLRNLAHGLLVITDAQPFRFPFHSVSRLYFVSTIATGASASMVSPSSHS